MGIPQTIGARIRSAREALGLTQEELADASGAHRSSVARWERDEAQPRGIGLGRLARALQTSVDWLREGGSERPPRIIQVEGLDADVQLGGARVEATVQATGRHGMVRDAGMEPLLYRLRGLIAGLTGVLAELEAREGLSPDRAPSEAEVRRAREVMEWVESQKGIQPSSPGEGDPRRRAQG